MNGGLLEPFQGFEKIRRTKENNVLFLSFLMILPILLLFVRSRVISVNHS